jgi:hypothetical protein
MSKIGYGWLVEHFSLNVTPIKHEHFVAGVPQKTTKNGATFHPVSVMPIDPVGHLEFAIKNEGINLQVISRSFDNVPAKSLADKLRQSPSGEYIRRLCFIYEWMRGEGSLGDVPASPAKYIEMFPSEKYETRKNVERHQRFRVIDNAIGNKDFCPLMEISDHRLDIHVCAKEIQSVKEKTDKAIFDRAIQYLYLAETKSSFSIEKETPSASRAEKFVNLLKTSVADDPVTEDMLVSAQNSIMAYPHGKESSFRTIQNWLESAGRITVFPPSPGSMDQLMDGWLRFVSEKNDIDPIVKAAGASFGFVYIHPFLDGNGRIHRFMIHKILSKHLGGVVLPVSTSMLKNEDEYLGVLNAFSKPVYSLWDFERIDNLSPPRITKDPGATPYQYFDMSSEYDFLSNMIRHALYQELPGEIAFIENFDNSMLFLKDFELPQKDASLMIRLVVQNNGELSIKKRKQFFSHISDDLLNDMEMRIADIFGIPALTPAHPLHSANAGRWC